MSRKIGLLIGLLCSSTLVACTSPNRGGRGGDAGVPGGNPGGSDGGVNSGDDLAGVGPVGSDGCSDDAKLVYVVDDNNTLSQFDPQAKTFKDLGKLACESQGSPFSMGVDRNAQAWVLYQRITHDPTFGDSFDTSVLYKVDPTSLGCSASAWQPQSNIDVFGMGFSTDSVGGTTDTLFISGDHYGSNGLSSGSQMATLDLSSGRPTTFGSKLSGNPELSGTGDAKLWGYFPNGSAPGVYQIDKHSGALSNKVTLPSAAQDSQPKAWAFAVWGGEFWIFLEKKSDSATKVYHVDTSGNLKDTIPTSGRTIVGAGVSTCAPTNIP